MGKCILGASLFRFCTDVVMEDKSTLMWQLCHRHASFSHAGRESLITALFIIQLSGRTLCELVMVLLIMCKLGGVNNAVHAYGIVFKNQ